MPSANSKQAMAWYTQWTLNKGLFSNIQEVDIPLDGASEIDNFIYRDGFLRCRPGTLEILDPKPSSDPVGHIGLFPRTATNPLNIACTLGGTAPYDLDIWVGYPWPGVATFSLANSVNFTRQLTHAQFKDEYYIAPGEDDILVIKTDGTVEPVGARQAVNALKPPGRPRYVTANDGRLWLANTLNGPSYVGTPYTTRIPYRIHCSDFLQSHVWNGGIDGGSSRYWDLAGEPDPITAIWASGDQIVAWKRRAIYTGAFVGPPLVYNFTRTARGVGCISMQTIREWRNGILVWLGDDNVYAGAIGQKPQAVGDAIAVRLKEIAQIGGYDNLRMARALIDPQYDLYHLFIAGTADGLVDKVFTLDLTSGAWFEGTFPEGMEIWAATSVVQGDYDNINTDDFWNNNFQLGCRDGRLLSYSWNFNSDDGEAIVCRYRTGIWNYAKMANRETMIVEPQAVRILGPDTGAVATLNVHPQQLYNRAAGNGFSGNQEMNAPDKMYVSGRCEGESFSISIAADSSVEIAGLGVGYIPRGDIHYYR